MEYLLLVGTISAFAVSAVFVKQLTFQWTTTALVLAVILGIVGYIFDYMLLKRVSLIETAILYAAGEIFLLTLWGHFYFKEPLNSYHFVAILFAIASAICISLAGQR